MREPTIRKQNIHRNHLKIRLIFFGILALALVIASYFSEYLCPYDPICRIWVMQRQCRPLHISLVLTDMDGICCPV